jgi:hypothetical protein
VDVFADEIHNRQQQHLSVGIAEVIHGIESEAIW